MRHKFLALMAALATSSLVFAAAASGAAPVFVLLWGQSFADKPRSFRMSGDSTLFAQKLHWDSWGGKTADGTGVAAFNTCKPDCAAGHFDHYPAKIVLSKRRYCSLLKFTVYEVTTLTVTGKHNLHGYDRNQVLSVPCRGEPNLT